MAKDRLKEYEAIVKDITDHKYAIPVNVYGSIKYAPRKNALGVFIRRPEHVMYGWNLNKLEHRKEEILEKIRELTHMELEVRRTLS